MVQTSFATMTNVGRAKEAAALASGSSVVITQIAIGDGATVPSGGETALYNEVDRKTISGSGTVVGSTNVAYFDAFLAAADGPYTIREAGLYDNTGTLIAIAHYDPPISKPVPASGQTVEGTIRMEVAFSNVANISIVIDPAMKVALQRLSTMPWIPVLSMTTAAPPASPAVGDCYLVPTGATGAWASQAGKIAEYTTAGWAIIATINGHGISLPDGRIFEKVAGSYVEKVAMDVQTGKWSYAAAGGTANALTVTLAPVPVSYAAIIGAPIRILTAVTNTGAVTLNVNGFGAKAVQLIAGEDLRPGDIVPGIIECIYDGTRFILRPTESSVRNSAAKSKSTVVTLTTGSGTFTVPSGIYLLDVELVAPGGGGGYAAAGGAGPGGNGGSTVRGRLSVTPGQIIAWAIGVPGSGGTAGIQAQAGGDAVFGSWTAKGGTAAANVGAVAGSAVSVATGSVGPEIFQGQQAEAGFIISGSQQWGGHGGQSVAGGFGGNGARNGGTAGNSGSAPGGGGGGGSNASTGGAGGAGQITVRY